VTLRLHNSATPTLQYYRRIDAKFVTNCHMGYIQIACVWNNLNCKLTGIVEGYFIHAFVLVINSALHSYTSLCMCVCMHVCVRVCVRVCVCIGLYVCMPILPLPRALVLAPASPQTRKAGYAHICQEVTSRFSLNLKKLNYISNTRVFRATCLTFWPNEASLWGCFYYRLATTGPSLKPAARGHNTINSINSLSFLERPSKSLPSQLYRPTTGEPTTLWYSCQSVQ